MISICTQMFCCNKTCDSLLNIILCYCIYTAVKQQRLCNASVIYLYLNFIFVEFYIKITIEIIHTNEFKQI